MARVCYMMLGDELVCINPSTTSEWMRFDKKQHTWKVTPNGNYFRIYLSEYVYDVFEKQRKKLVDQYSAFTTLATSMTDSNHEECLKSIQEKMKIMEIVKKQVKTEAYKSKIIKEASHCFVFFKESIDGITNFENELNMKPQLVGFKNGVFDLDEETYIIHWFGIDFLQEFVMYITVPISLIGFFVGVIFDKGDRS